MKTYNTVAIETDISGVDSNEELAALFAKAMELCQTAKTSHKINPSLLNTQYLSSHNVTYCIYNSANVDLQPVPLLENMPNVVYTQVEQDKESVLGWDSHRHEKADIEDGASYIQNCGTVDKTVCSISKEQYRNQEDLDEHTQLHKKEEGSQEQIEDAFAKHNNQACSLEKGIKKEESKTLQREQICEEVMEQNQTLERTEEEGQIILGKVNVKQRKDTSKKPKKKQCKNKCESYKCSHCGEVFNQKASYAKHLRIHSLARSQDFVCSYCNKVFPWISALRVHLRTHTKETPFPCLNCTKEFAIASALKDHVARKHSGEKPHKCSVCEKSFVKRWELTEHLRIHTGERPFKCDYCHKTFLRKPHLTVHLKIHTGERPHKCEFCEKGFVRKRDLIEHLRTHTGERPYKCDLCNKAFLRNTHLVQHLKTHSRANGKIK